MWPASARASLCGIIASVALADPLSPGSDALSCHNMLTPGSMSHCEATGSVPKIAAPAQVAPSPQPEAPPVLPPSTSDSKAVIGGVSEVAVDAYLANYGKPPREAVRALLQPTDENIAALAAFEKKRQIIASYVAQRWAELQQERGLDMESPTLSAYTILPHLIGMRLTTYVTPGCAACEAAVKVVNQLVDENPVAEVRLVVITDDDRIALETLLHAGVSWPVSTLSAQSAQARGVKRGPVIEVVDTRSHARRVVTGVPGLVALRDMVVRLRKSGTHPSRASP